MKDHIWSVQGRGYSEGPDTRGGMAHKSWDGGGDEMTHLAIHGDRAGLLRVDVLKKPQKGTPRDHIRLTLCGSWKGEKPIWHSFTDWEALEVARLLLWAISKRQRVKKRITLEMMK